MVERLSQQELEAAGHTSSSQEADRWPPVLSSWSSFLQFRTPASGVVQPRPRGPSSLANPLQVCPELVSWAILEPVRLAVSISHQDSLPPSFLGTGAAFSVVTQLTARGAQRWETPHSLCCCQPSGALRRSPLCTCLASLLCRPSLAP